MAKRLGEIMIQQGWINEEQLQKALKFQNQNACLIGEACVKLQFINETQLAQGLSKQLGIPYASIDNHVLAPEKGQGLEKILSEQFCRDNAVVPLFMEDGIMAVAVCDPTNMLLLDNLKLMSGMEIQLFVSTKDQILRTIDSFYSSQNIIDDIIDDKNEGSSDSVDDGLTPDGKLDLDRVIGSNSKGAQSIKLVNAIIKQAIMERTSDIHLERFDSKVSLRLRIDGVLYERTPPPLELLDSVISRVKILARLDVAERRLPQDGSFSIKYQNRIIETRVSVCPTVFGEKLVLRILDKGAVELKIDNLGFEPRQKADFLAGARAPNGLLFLTGPTGSGKTTTLNAVLNTIKSTEVNIMTLEDPVEIKMEGISQVQIKAQIGLTFAAGLRSFLRQDPDIILVGEVRDNETAEACLKAAMTGHLVLSTLHTNSALEAVPRLIDMGIERYLLASTLLVVAAQRLVRQLCPFCKQPYKPSRELIEQFNSECMLDPLPDPNKLVFYKAIGCPKCLNMGYKGRRAIYEIYFNTEAMKAIIYKDADVQRLEKEVAKSGACNLRAAGWHRVMAGLTTVEEMLAVTVTER